MTVLDKFKFLSPMTAITEPLPPSVAVLLSNASNIRAQYPSHLAHHWRRSHTQPPSLCCLLRNYSQDTSTASFYAFTNCWVSWQYQFPKWTRVFFHIQSSLNLYGPESRPEATFSLLSPFPGVMVGAPSDSIMHIWLYAACNKIETGPVPRLGSHLLCSEYSLNFTAQ